MTVEIIDVDLGGGITKQAIVYKKDDGTEITREHYTEEHPYYGWNFANLSPIEYYIISQRIS